MYRIQYTDQALKNLKKIDPTQQAMIISWIDKNLKACRDTRINGKPLKGSMKNYWLYRVGKYRIIADIEDEEIKIIIVNIGHGKDIYK